VATSEITIAVKTDGTLWSWGTSANGQLGISAVARSSPVQVGSLTDWSLVAVGAVGGDNHVAAVKTDGTLWAWGRNNYGQIGDNTIINRSSPVQIGGLTNWALVGTGDNHTASVKTDGTLWTWGSSSWGQIGDNTIINRSSPVQVGSLTNWYQVSAGDNFTASVKTDGTLWTWGVNASSQLGQNNTIPLSSPVQVGALTNWYRVATGEEHVLALYGVV
jgi:alpha-tubulin suppressor-like RCC1 family protein